MLELESGETETGENDTMLVGAEGTSGQARSWPDEGLLGGFVAKRLIRGENDLASQNTPVLNQWDYEKNYPLTPQDVSYASTKKVWWICGKAHSWYDSIESRFYSTGECPVCNNQRIISGINDLPTIYPKIMESWDYEKNTVDPRTLSGRASQSVFWKCEKGHSWKTSVSNRVKQDGCPYCGGRKIWAGFNDLKTLFPELIQEWDNNLNTVDPERVAPATGEKCHWICPLGHPYEASVASRTRLHTGCPYCANQKLLVGFNDCATVYPYLVSEWDYGKNRGKTPADYIAGSETDVWWLCSKGHSWKTKISTRVSKGGTGCPICAKEYKTSIPEQAVYFYCKKYFSDAIGNYQPDWIGKSEIDIFIPSVMVGLEYDGCVWHKNVERDKQKNKLCQSNGISIIRLREPGLESFNDKCIPLASLSKDDLSKGIIAALLMLGIKDADVDVVRDIDEIYKLMDYQEKENSLQNKNPEIAKQWDYKKNGKYLSPMTINSKSRTAVYWICDKGHSYKTRIDSRTIMKSGCPICAGKKIKPGFNDFASQHPALLSEWDYSSNDKKPDQYSSGHHSPVKWICKRGHKWSATISNRIKGSGCPYCAGQRAIAGESDVKTVDPKLIEEWDYDKNVGIMPEMFLPQSSYQIWWKCKQGHSWQDSIKKRFKQKNRYCPVCRKMGINDRDH